jgi:hypothetical protein
VILLAVKSIVLPLVFPIVKAERLAPVNAMLPMFKAEVLPAVEFIESEVVELVLEKVAKSALSVVPIAPGKVPAPVLQLASAPAASQMPFVGVAFQVALAARAESTWRTTPAPARVMANDSDFREAEGRRKPRVFGFIWILLWVFRRDVFERRSSKPGRRDDAPALRSIRLS